MTISRAVEIFYSGEKLKFGDDEYIVAKQRLKKIKKNTPDYRIFSKEVEKYAKTY